MKPTALVLTTVHSADDTRIRERLIRTLGREFEIVYAARAPRPTDESGILSVTLDGGRLSRNLRAIRVCFRYRWDLLILHDPETIPLGVIAKALKRRAVVFDVHEDLAAQISAKDWIPRWARAPMRVVSRWLYRLAEHYLTLTLAEPGYSRLFRRPHPIFPNYPRSASWPPPSKGRESDVIYVGDVQPRRGIADAVHAASLAEADLVVVGQCAPEFAAELADLARQLGVNLTLTGRIDHPRALAMMATAGVGVSPLLRTANHEHSLPTKTLEYLAMGIPVVATDLPGTREAIGPLKAVWLVPPGDVAAMGEAIRLALTDESRSDAAGQSSRVRARFGWPESGVINFYLRLVAASEDNDVNR